MILLEPKELTWLESLEDDSIDLCAHGKVRFEIDGKVLVSEADGEWTVSASALYLLRTLEANHTKEAPLFQHVFPCCGFNMYDIKDEKDVVIIGCPRGINFEIVHEEPNVKILADNGKTFVATQKDWQEAVIRFSELVMGFYSASNPKTPTTELSKNGFDKFMAEWKRRHAASLLNE